MIKNKNDVKEKRKKKIQDPIGGVDLGLIKVADRFIRFKFDSNGVKSSLNRCCAHF